MSDEPIAELTDKITQIHSDVCELAKAFLYLSSTVSRLDIRMVPPNLVQQMEEADRRVKEIARRTGAS